MRSRPSVLVVDDRPATCRFIATALQQAGYNVEIACNGHEGLAKIRMFQPSCLMLDVLLPNIPTGRVITHKKPPVRLRID